MWARSRSSSRAWALLSPLSRRGGATVKPRSVPLLIGAAVALWLAILLASDCASSASRPRVLPPAPILESSTSQSDGGICLGRADTAELLLYIETLERMARE